MGGDVDPTGGGGGAVHKWRPLGRPEGEAVFGKVNPGVAPGKSGQEFFFFVFFF